MSAKSRKPEPLAPAAPAEPGERVRLWLLAGLLAVCVARPLVPSEGVAWLGDGHAFTLILLLLTAGYLALVGVRQSLVRPLDMLDVCVAVLILALVSSSMLGLAARSAGFGSGIELSHRLTTPRLATNMLWESVSLGLVYFLTRQLVASRREARSLIAIMIGLAVAISALGLFQVAFTLPVQRAAYAENPDAVLQAVGQWFPADSPERQRFEARLASTEPLATFALTNSLAGFLAPWFLLGIGIAWPARCSLASSQSSRGDAATPVAASGRRWFALAAGYYLLALGMLLACLLLTRSRSAYFALFLGLLLLPLVYQAGRRFLTWRLLVGVAGGLLVVICAAFVGRWDDTLWSEAQKSLGYRFEYWDATLNMIADFPLFGVGPGEFQNYYTQYKLPEASEEVSDPHNFVLEVWATGGTFALLALAATLAALVCCVWQASRTEVLATEPTSDSRDSGKVLALGALAGLPLAFVVGLPFGFYLPLDQLAATALVGGGVVAALAAWSRRGWLPPWLPALGILVLLVHWLASGGFGFPGVAFSLWMLVAIASQPTDAEPVEVAQPLTGWQRLALPLALVLPMLMLAYSCYRTGLLPVAASRAAMALATDPRMSDETRFTAILGAISADPLAHEPWMACMQLSTERLVEDPDDQTWQDRLYRSATSIISLQGGSSAAARELRRMFELVYDAADDKTKLAEWLLTSARSAAQLYPNSAILQAEYALTLDLLGNHRTARQAALRALELDELTPHADKKLSPAVRDQLEALIEAAVEPPPDETDEVE